VSKWYLRNSNASTGPTGKASTDTDDFPSVPSDKTTAKDMAAGKGSAQVSVTGNYNNAGVAKKTFCRIFVGPALAAQTLTGAQANYKVGVAIKESNALMNLVHRTFVYVWRSGSGNVKTIIVPTEHIEHTTAELGCLVTATGAATDFSILNGDRIVVELWWNLNNTKNVAYDATDYYEGATDVIDATATSDAAAYFECPQTLTLTTVYYKSAAVTESSAIAIAKRQKRTSAITESGGVTISKRQRRNIAVAEASSVTVTKKIQHLVSILETANVTAQVKRLYLIAANIVSSNILWIRKKQSRSIGLQETSILQILKAQRRQVTVTEASSVTTAKRQQRLINILETSNMTVALKRVYVKLANVTSSIALSIQKKQSRFLNIQESSLLTVLKMQRRLTQITAAAQVTFNYLKTFKLAFSISTTPVIAAAKKQLRAFTITATPTVTVIKKQSRSLQLAASSIVTFSKQLISGGGQVYHLAFDITSAAIMAARKKQLRAFTITATSIVSASKKQFRAILVTATPILAIRKTQRRIVSLLATASFSVRKLQRRRFYIAASSLITHILNLIVLVLDGREAVRAAFATILTNADLGVPVYTRMPYWGAEPRSVVLTIVSGSSRRGALGLWIRAGVRGLEEPYRLRADCYHDDQLECEKLADKVEQGIVESASVLASTYDIHNVRKVADIDTMPPDLLLRESRILLDFEFYTHRALT